ncbi:MAG: AsmA family protein [Gammaproteobacteria bacterium]|nr:AsmA family protein [Gammaproteobacteria bacterium]
MNSRIIFTRLFKSLVIFIAVLILFVGMLDFIKLSFTLDGGRRLLVEHIKSHTGREARIDGEVKLTISLIPQLLVQRIHISNTGGFGDEDFITVSKVRIDLSIIPLLSGQLRFDDISADQTNINLIRNKAGRDNWTFDNTAQSSTASETKTNESSIWKNDYSRLSIGAFQLTDVSIRYNDQSRDQVIDTHLDQLTIDLNDATNPLAEISGNMQGHPYSLAFESDALQVLASGKPWLLHGTGHIANKKTQLEASVQFIEGEIKGNVDVNVKKVNLGLLLDKLEIIKGREAATESVNITVKTHGSEPVELYKQAEIGLDLGKGYWNLQSDKTGQKKQLSFTGASAYTSWYKPVALHLDGRIEGETIKIDFKTNRLLEFFDEVPKLDVDLAASIADTDIKLTGTINLPIATGQYKLDLSLKGKDLEKLNPVIDTDFPAFNHFSLSGTLIANEKGYILKSDRASIGETKLQASIVIDTTSLKPDWTINLSSRELQLKDFAFYDLESKQASFTNVKISTKNENAKPYLEPLRTLQATVADPDMYLILTLNVDKLLSGKDVLGKGRFRLHLRDNAISLENADIELPGGRVIASILFQIEDSEARGHAKLNIDKLDYGITTRLFKPDSQVDGIISIRTDLELAGRDFTRLLDKATGQLDIAIWPRNTKPAKLLNLWATNLYLVLLPELKKKESKVNCLVGLMNLNEGIMKEEFFAIDTTKLWIYGNFNVNFRQEHVKLSLFPRSKTARFFALESPIRAQGSFSDIDLAVNPVDLTTGYISFIMSPLTVPTRWIFGDKPVEDGSAICEQFFDRPYVEKLNREIKQKEKEDIKKLLDAE